MRAFIMVLVIAVLGIASPVLSAGIPTMDKDGLKAVLGSDDVVVIDVRAGRDWSSSEFMIKGASREEPSEVANWAEKYDKEKTVVLYCAWPSEYTSASVARKLVDRGYNKVYALKGGWREWFRSKYPTQEKSWYYRRYYKHRVEQQQSLISRCSTQPRLFYDSPK